MNSKFNAAVSAEQQVKCWDSLRKCEQVRNKYMTLNDSEKAELVALTGKRFLTWLKQRLADDERANLLSSPSKHCHSSTGRSPRRCLSVPSPCQQAKYPMKLDGAMEQFLEGGHSRIHSGHVFDRSPGKELPRFSFPSVLPKSPLAFSFDKFGNDSIGEEATTEPIDYSDEEVFVEEQSKTSEECNLVES